MLASSNTCTAQSLSSNICTAQSLPSAPFHPVLLSFDTLAFNLTTRNFFFSGSLISYLFSAMGAPLLRLNNSSGQSLIKPLSAYLHIPIKRYSRSSSIEHGLGEKAPSTDQEFQRVAAEKRELQRLAEEKARRVVVSQTSDKALEAAQVAVLEDSNLETVKVKYKGPSGGEDPERKGD